MQRESTESENRFLVWSSLWISESQKVILNRFIIATSLMKLKMLEINANSQPYAGQAIAQTKGLLNMPGQNNCFLNSAVQVGGQQPFSNRLQIAKTVCKF